jgi:hypothetical protein
MRPRNFAFLFLGMASAAASQQQSLGIFGQWGAFAREGRCYAISEPPEAARSAELRAFASIGYVQGRRARGQVYFRLNRPKREGSAVLLRVDSSTFQLRGGGAHAWATDAAADAAILVAIRTGIEMHVETRSPTGGLVRDSYRLRGAATAIDAAAIACARRG